MEASSAGQSTELNLTPAGSLLCNWLSLEGGEDRQNACGSESGSGVFHYARVEARLPPADANLAVRL